MSIPVIDKIKPLGGFAIADQEDIQCGDKRLNTVLGEKVEKVSGKGLSTNDYSNDDKNKVASLSGMFTLVD